MVKFEKTETALVPAVALGLDDDGPALRERQVLDHKGRSVIVDAGSGRSISIGTARAHKDFAVGLIRIGDLRSEAELLDPLAESLY